MNTRSHRSTLFGARLLGAACLCLMALLFAGCATVRPEQRAILADPTMQYEASPLEEGARQHVYDNREGNYGGGSVEGGGCGCN
jgi:hypothetical protein